MKRDGDSRDYLREHWRSRRDRIRDELKGMEDGLKALPDTQEGAEVRQIIETKTRELRLQLDELEGRLGFCRGSARH